MAYSKSNNQPVGTGDERSSIINESHKTTRAIIIQNVTGEKIVSNNQPVVMKAATVSDKATVQLSLTYVKSNTLKLTINYHNRERQWRQHQ